MLAHDLRPSEDAVPSWDPLARTCRLAAMQAREDAVETMNCKPALTNHSQGSETICTVH